MANLESDTSSGWDLQSHLDMPSAREIELDLALGSDSWQSLLVTDKPSPEPTPGTCECGPLDRHRRQEERRR
jgi:hypothetical protein